MLAVSKLSIGRVKQRAAMCLGRPQVLREECKLARGAGTTGRLGRGKMQRAEDEKR